MKATTIENLQAILDSDLIWRRKEMSSLITLSNSADSIVKLSLIRASVTLMYAHWEGFSRECFVRYLEFVSFKRVKYRNLIPSFVYLSSSISLSGFQSKRAKGRIEIINNFISKMDDSNKDSFRKNINTRSNLRSEVLEDLLVSCGLPDEIFRDHHEFIDREICDARNEIAHGSGAAPTFETLLRRRVRIFEIMTQLQTTVTNAAVNKAYVVS